VPMHACPTVATPDYVSALCFWKTKQVLPKVIREYYVATPTSENALSRCVC